jgi:hypothetical protein
LTKTGSETKFNNFLKLTSISENIQGRILGGREAKPRMTNAFDQLTFFVLF